MTAHTKVDVTLELYVITSYACTGTHTHTHTHTRTHTHTSKPPTMRQRAKQPTSSSVFVVPTCNVSVLSNPIPVAVTMVCKISRAVSFLVSAMTRYLHKLLRCDTHTRHRSFVRIHSFVRAFVRSRSRSVRVDRSRHAIKELPQMALEKCKQTRIGPRHFGRRINSLDLNWTNVQRKFQLCLFLDRRRRSDGAWIHVGPLASRNRSSKRQLDFQIVRTCNGTLYNVHASQNSMCAAQ